MLWGITSLQWFPNLPWKNGKITLYPINDSNEIKYKYVVNNHKRNRPANLLDEHSSRKHIYKRKF